MSGNASLSLPDESLHGQLKNRLSGAIASICPIDAYKMPPICTPRVTVELVLILRLIIYGFLIVYCMNVWYKRSDARRVHAEEGNSPVQPLVCLSLLACYNAVASYTKMVNWLYAEEVSFLFTIKKTTTTTTNEIIRKADLQLQELQQAIDQTQNAISQAQARIDHISQAADQRTEELTTAYDRIQELAGSAQRAQSYADLAAGTRQERETSMQHKHAQSELSKAQASYDQDLDRSAKEQKKEEELTRAAHEQIAKKQQELDNLYSRQASMIASRDQAITDRGRDLSAAAMSAIETQQSRIASIAACLTGEQEVLSQLLKEKIEELQEYPELAREIGAMQPLNDATSRVLAGAIRYISTLIAERYDLADTLHLPATRYVDHFWDLLAVPSGELLRDQSLRSNISRLESRLEKLRLIEGEYRESRR